MEQWSGADATDRLREAVARSADVAERQTRWLIGLTWTLVALTLALVVLTVQLVMRP